jgi:hypothetical protein
MFEYVLYILISSQNSDVVNKLDSFNTEVECKSGARIIRNHYNNLPSSVPNGVDLVCLRKAKVKFL